MKILILITTIFFLTACSNESQVTKITTGSSYSGLDLSGQSKTCTHKTGMMCTEIYGKEDAYADDCRSKGLKVVQCDCHDFICLE
jgi:hypothetical protein